MGSNIYESSDESTIARRIAAGDAHGLPPQPAIVITTRLRARNEDYVVLTLQEARDIAKAILAALAEE